MLPVLAALVMSFSQTQAPVHADGGSVFVKGKKFLTEVARTPQAQLRGLMFRQTFKPDRAMFFLYGEDAKRTIWMKNCYISLDVVWIDADGRVVELAERCPPCSAALGDNCPNYGGKELSRHFIEFAAGTIKRLNLKVGDRVGWDLAFIDGTSSKGGVQEAAAKGKPAAKAKGKGKR